MQCIVNCCLIHCTVHWCVLHWTVHCTGVKYIIQCTLIVERIVLHGVLKGLKAGTLICIYFAAFCSFLGNVSQPSDGSFVPDLSLHHTGVDMHCNVGTCSFIRRIYSWISKKFWLSNIFTIFSLSKNYMWSNAVWWSLMMRCAVEEVSPKIKIYQVSHKMIFIHHYLGSVHCTSVVYSQPLFVV